VSASDKKFHHKNGGCASLMPPYVQREIILVRSTRRVDKLAHPPIMHITNYGIWLRNSRTWWMRFAYATLHLTRNILVCATRRVDKLAHPPIMHIINYGIWLRNSRAWWMRCAYATLLLRRNILVCATRRVDKLAHPPKIMSVEASDFCKARSQ